jgi:hypothetical protein
MLSCKRKRHLNPSLPFACHPERPFAQPPLPPVPLCPRQETLADPDVQRAGAGMAASLTGDRYLNLVIRFAEYHAGAPPPHRLLALPHYRCRCPYRGAEGEICLPALSTRSTSPVPSAHQSSSTHAWRHTSASSRPCPGPRRRRPVSSTSCQSTPRMRSPTSLPGSLRLPPPRQVYESTMVASTIGASITNNHPATVW